MSETAAKRKRPDYGIDAPTEVRNLILGGAAALVLALVSFLLNWGLTRMATVIGIGYLILAGWMVWGSKVKENPMSRGAARIPSIVGHEVRPAKLNDLRGNDRASPGLADRACQDRVTSGMSNKNAVKWLADASSPAQTVGGRSRTKLRTRPNELVTGVPVTSTT
jgi:hypothetical protein